MERNGGRPKKETTGFEKVKTNGYKNTKSKTEPNVNENENVNENVNVNDNVNGNDSCVDGFQKVIDFYNINIGLITPYGVEILEDYAKEMDINLIILAMQKAVEADVRTIQYIKGILNNWSKKGITTVLEAQKEDEKFKHKGEAKDETEEEATARKIKELEESINGD